MLASGVPEDDVQGEPVAVALELAIRKAAAVAARAEDALVIGCDSLLELDGSALGKPATAAEARQRWQSMRGRSGVLHTGHCVIDTRTQGQAAAVCSTTVHFGTPSDAEVDAYVASGEPLQVAGAFTLDGRSAPFVAGIDGDAGNVIGLSLPLLRELLAQLGTSLVDLWS